MAAPNTPRQEQYLAAATAQEHNLSNNLLTSLLNEGANVPPDGERSQPERVWGPDRGAALRAAVAQAHNLPPDLQATLYNLAANVPPDGRDIVWDRFQRRERPDITPAVAQAHNLSANLAGTLYNEAANVPPDGERLLVDPYPVRAGRAHLDTSWVQDLQGTTLAPAAPAALPDGRARLWDRPPVRPSGAQAGRPGANLLGTLLNEGANTPPDGDRLLWERRDQPSARGYLDPNVQNPQNLLSAAPPAALPDGRGYQPDRVWGRESRAQFGAPGADLQQTLLNAAANVPPDGKIVYLDRFARRERPDTTPAVAQAHNLATNLAPTLLNEAANVPPDGERIYLDRFTDRNRRDPLVAARAQLHDVGPAPLLTAAAAVPPPGDQRFIDRWSPRFAPQPLGPATGQLHNLSVNLAGTLRNEAANVPPPGARWDALPLPRPEGRPVWPAEAGPGPQSLLVGGIVRGSADGGLARSGVDGGLARSSPDGGLARAS